MGAHLLMTFAGVPLTYWVLAAVVFVAIPIAGVVIIMLVARFTGQRVEEFTVRRFSLSVKFERREPQR